MDPHLAGPASYPTHGLALQPLSTKLRPLLPGPLIPSKLRVHELEGPRPGMWAPAHLLGLGSERAQGEVE